MPIIQKKKILEKLLDVDAEMSGNLVFKDPVNLRINGKFEGRLETRGNLTIGETGVVSGEIIGEDITVCGRVKGKIIATQKLTFLPTARVEGEIRTNKLVVSEGAYFEGVSHMISEYLSIEELAHYLEVDTSTIEEWANSGKIPAKKEGDVWKFERNTIDEWIAKGKLT
jgi:excisionase family DNA binding protein